MSSTFFLSWELWQKMVFILGCGLVVTIIGGIIKLWYTHWRVRKYAALEKLADRVQIIRDKSIIRSLSTKNVRKPKRKLSAPPPMQQRNLIQVPFGIRALEEGIHFDEVWDSRPSSRDVSQSDLTTFHASNASTTDLQQTSTRYTSKQNSSGFGSDNESDSDISTLHLTPKLDGRSNSDTPLPTQPSNRSKYPPHSFAKYEGTGKYRMRNSFGPRSGMRLQPNDALQQSSTTHSFESFYSPATSLSEETSPGADRLHSDFRTARALTNSTPSSIRSVSADSVLAMHQRRMSQVAETGQLLPRHRSEPLDRDLAIEIPVMEATDSDRLSFETSIEGGDGDTKHFSTPSIRITANTPDADGVPTTPPATRRGRRLRRRSVTPPSTPGSSSFSLTSRKSLEVLRHVNSDFAILKPGTLKTRLTLHQSGTTSHVRSTSTESGRSAGSHRRRRLQKRMSADQGGKRGSRHE